MMDFIATELITMLSIIARSSGLCPVKPLHAGSWSSL